MTNPVSSADVEEKASGSEYEIVVPHANFKDVEIDNYFVFNNCTIYNAAEV